jgi:L-asparaginase
MPRIEIIPVRRGSGRTPLHLLLLLLPVLAMSAATPPADPRPPLPGESGQPLPEVHILATGGTIASRAGAGPLSVEQLVEAVPGIEGLARITVEQFANVGSSRITPEHWLGLSRRVAELYAERPDLSGVVVTHGTDTLEETALFLHLTVGDPRPVVLTGAMRPPSAVAPEGPANLRAAVALAALPEARGRGTLVVMNDEIFSAGDVAKVHTSRLDAFVAPAGGRVGTVESGVPRFHAPPSPPPVRVELAGVEELPRIDIAYAWAGADGAAVEAAVAAGARGLVLASVGQGNLPPALGVAAREAAERGVATVVSSRTGAGRVPVGPLDPAPGRPVLLPGAGALNPQRARVVLMLALARGDDLWAIARLLERF